MVTKEEGLAFAEEYGCLFLESSAKTRENVEKCFEELALKVCLEKYIRHRNVIHLKPFFLLGLVHLSVNPCGLDGIE
jgi:hypothetical protein